MEGDDFRRGRRYKEGVRGKRQSVRGAKDLFFGDLSERLYFVRDWG